MAPASTSTPRGRSSFRSLRTRSPPTGGSRRSRAAAEDAADASNGTPGPGASTAGAAGPTDSHREGFFYGFGKMPPEGKSFAGVVYQRRTPAASAREQIERARSRAAAARERARSR